MTEVSREKDSTPVHRLRAAGIAGRPCRLKLDEPEDEVVVVSDGTDEAGPSTSAVGKCSEKKCKHNPLCLNYVGGREVCPTVFGHGAHAHVLQLVRPEAKEAYVEQRLGPAPEIRDGPAGLRNLGATCYVSLRHALLA